MEEDPFNPQAAWPHMKLTLHRHQAQPFSPHSRRDVLHPALPWPDGQRRPGGRPAVCIDGGLSQPHLRFDRRSVAAERACQVRGRDRRGARQGQPEPQTQPEAALGTSGRATTVSSASSSKKRFRNTSVISTAACFSLADSIAAIRRESEAGKRRRARRSSHRRQR
jgi:hypothetical protein